MSETTRTARPIMWLTYAVLVTALVSTATLSRYMTSISATDSVTVASVAMESAGIASLDVDLSDISLGTSKYFSFDVVNFTDSRASEVTQDYYIEILTTGNLPITYTLTTVDEDTSSHALTSANGGLMWTGGVLEHSVDSTHSYTLTISWPAEEIDYSYMDEVDAVKIVVHSQQRNESTATENN